MRGICDGKNMFCMERLEIKIEFSHFYILLAKCYFENEKVISNRFNKLTIKNYYMLRNLIMCYCVKNYVCYLILTFNVR